VLHAVADRVDLGSRLVKLLREDRAPASVGRQRRLMARKADIRKRSMPVKCH